MFEALSSKLNGVFDRLRRRGALSEADVTEALREVRVALLEADVALPVVRDLVARVKERAVGQEVIRSVSPAQQVIKIVHATPNHRWLRQTKGSYADGRHGDLVELTTDDLRPGHRIPSVWSAPAGTLRVSPQGVARGFTYGDGTTIRSGARALFCGPKDSHLLPYFAPAEVKYDRRGVGRIAAVPSGPPGPGGSGSTAVVALVIKPE
jgi:hypothetical protein